MSERPVGVTILGILWIIQGLFMLLGGIFGGVLLSIMGNVGIGAVIGIVLFIVGIVDLLLGIGCFNAWPWVWTIGIIFSVIGILGGIANLATSWTNALVGIVISAIILYYLFQPQVKAYFGKA